MSILLAECNSTKGLAMCSPFCFLPSAVDNDK